MKIDSQQVKKLRAEKGWSQQQLADICDLNIRTIQRVERVGTASLETVNALLTVFDISRDVLKISEQSKQVPNKAKSFNYGFWLTALFLLLHLILYFLTLQQASLENKHLSFMDIAVYSSANSFNGSIQLPLFFYINNIMLALITYVFHKRDCRWLWMPIIWVPFTILYSSFTSGMLTPLTVVISVVVGCVYYFERKKFIAEGELASFKVPNSINHQTQPNKTEAD